MPRANKFATFTVNAGKNRSGKIHSPPAQPHHGAWVELLFRGLTYNKEIVLVGYMRGQLNALQRFRVI
jgi:hypothetical protein